MNYKYIQTLPQQKFYLKQNSKKKIGYKEKMIQINSKISIKTTTTANSFNIITNLSIKKYKFNL